MQLLKSSDKKFRQKVWTKCSDKNFGQKVWTKVWTKSLDKVRTKFGQMFGQNVWTKCSDKKFGQMFGQLRTKFRQKFGQKGSEFWTSDKVRTKFGQHTPIWLKWINMQNMCSVFTIVLHELPLLWSSVEAVGSRKEACTQNLAVKIAFHDPTKNMQSASSPLFSAKDLQLRVL